MRPLHLSIEGLRSFRTPVSIDFAGRDHVAIVGDTGAGKSSILEAVTYALYGQTTFTAQANQELMNDTSLHLRVVLRFRVSGETWEVARTLRRDGQGRVGSPNAQLRRLSADGETVEQVEQVKPVNDGIKDLIGLDSDAFLRTVVLPQGRFARLLVEDRPTDRGRILRQVWRTDELEAAGALAGAARHEAERLRERLAQAASGYPDDPAAHLAALQAAREAAGRDADAATEDERAAAAAHEALLSAATARREAAGVTERLRALDVDGVAGVLAPIAAAERRIAGEEAAHEQRQAGLEDELARVPADDGPTREEVAAALTTLSSLGDLAKAAEEAAADLRAAASDVSRKQTEARRRAESAEAARQRAADHATKRAPLDEAAERARRRRDAVEQKHARCVERTAERDAARQRLDALRAEEAERAESLEAARQAARRATREAAGADDHLAAARRSESAALAARDLHAGDACPICRRDLPDDWEAPHAAGLADAEKIARAAHEAAREADAAVTALRTERNALARQAAEAETGLADLQAALDTARRELAQEAGLTGLPLETGLTGASSAAAPTAAKTGQPDAAARPGPAGEAGLTGPSSPAAPTAAPTGLPDAAARPGPAGEAGLTGASSAAAPTAAPTGQPDAAAPELTRQPGPTGPPSPAAPTAAPTGLPATAARPGPAGEAGLTGPPSPAAPMAAQPGVPDAARPEPAPPMAAQPGVPDAEAPLPERDALLAPLEAACNETAAALAAHDRRAEELRADAAAEDTAAGVAREAAANAGAAADQSRRLTVRAVERLEAAVRVVPEPFRPSLGLPPDAAGLHEVDLGPVGEQTESAQARARVLGARETEQRRLRSAIEDTRKARSALARRRAEEVDTPLDELVRELHACRDVLVESVRRLALDVDVPDAVSTREVGALESNVAALRTKAAELSRAAAEHARAAVERADAARAELAAIRTRLDPATDLDTAPATRVDPATDLGPDAATRVDPATDLDPDAVLDAARAKAEDARFQARRAAEAADGFATIADDVEGLRGLLQEVDERALALGDLEDALKPGAFLKWLTLRRSRRLLVHASRMLGEMSGGKYAFVDPGETDEQWQVLDADSGRPRSPASLSGGEQFIASLSLALGMVEMMARSGGRLESLFLDEGFGSLDRNNLDAAVQALGAVAAGGRMVGVISHVRAVAEQIEHVLAVTRGPTGSRAEWLTSGQRERLSESDTGLEAASALAGLLE